MKKYFKYIFIFIISVVFLNFIPFDLDEVWNYGFMHNIYEGSIPYKDFNMVITPFFPFLFSLPFHIFGSNMLVVCICQSLLIVCIYILFEKMFGDKANILLLLLFLNYDMLYASYNFFVFFLFVLLLYMEKKKCNDYLIGFVIGLAVLTKQSVGGCLALVSLYYVFKDRNFKKLGKRILGALIPVSVFIIYMLVTNSYKEFIDLCILGLFDFGTNNYVGSRSFVFVYIVLLIILGYVIKTKRNCIDKYYVLAFSIIALPMFDFFHMKFFAISVAMLFISKLELKRINLNLLMWGSMLGFLVVNFFAGIDGKIIYPNPINHFEYKYISGAHIKETQIVSDKIMEYSDKELILLFEQSYYYKIVNDLKINYYDLINTGNWGYNGSKKLLKGLENKKNAIFVINRNSYKGTRQTDKTALKFVLKNCKKIDEIYGFEFYVRK